MFPPWLCLWNLEPEVYLYDKACGGVQRGATRVLLPKLSYNEWLERLALLLLVYRREVRDLVTFYKLKYGHYNLLLVWLQFQFCSGKRLRSFSSNKLRLNLVKTKLFKGTFFLLEFLIYVITDLTTLKLKTWACHASKNIAEIFIRIG